MPTSQPGLSEEGLSIDDGPTALRGAAYSVLREHEQANSFAQQTYNWVQGETTAPLVDGDEEDDEEGFFPLPGEGQPASGTPMVQGTPQWGGVPSVQGSTGAPSAAASLRNAASAPSPFAPSAAPITPPVSWQPVPLRSSATMPRASIPSHKAPRTGKKPSAGGGSCGLVALIIAVVCLILVGTIGGLFFGVPPTLTIVGSNTVIVGGNLHVHGAHFLPGSSVSMTLDESIRLFTADPPPLASAQVASVLQMTVAGPKTPIAKTGLKADGSGNFDVTILVSAGWGVGSHTIKATEATTGRSYLQKFTVNAPGAQLLAKPTLLDFGQLEVGSKAVLSVVVNNGGGQELNWQAMTSGETWLKLSLTSGSLAPAASPQFMFVTADVTHLKVGKYTSTLTITSNGGNARIDVKLEVIPPTPIPQAKLKVTPTSLDFGTLDVGSQVTKAIMIGNSGNVALNWKADTGNTNWVALDKTAHTVAPAGQPDIVNVTVDTANLAAGSQSAMLTITSNGGKAQVAITVVVNVPPPPPTPTPTPSPTPSPPCTLQAPSPQSVAFTVNTGANPHPQSFSINVTGTCGSGVTIMASAAMATGAGWLAVSPPAATPTGGSATFTINVTSANLAAGPYSGTITLDASDGNGMPVGSSQTVNVKLQVNRVLPVGSVSPRSLTFNVLTTDGVSSQDVTIANTGGSALDWSATLQNAPSFVQQSASSGTNVTSSTPATDSIQVEPAGAPAGKYVVTLTISMTDSLNGNALSGSPITVTITVNVTAPPTVVPVSPSMQLSKTTVTFKPTSCTYPVTDTVTLTNSGGGTLSWTVSSPTYTTKGDPGGWLTVSPSGQGSGDTTLKFSVDGTVQGLTAGQTYTASVTITPSSGNTQTVTVSFTVPTCATIG